MLNKVQIVLTRNKGYNLVVEETTNLVNNMNRNPEGRGGFKDHPAHRNSGGRPKNSESITFWYRRFLDMNVKEFLDWEKNPSGEERTVVASLSYARVRMAKESLKDFKEVADRTEGKAPQTVIAEGGLFNEDKLQITVVDSDSKTESDKSVV